MGYTQQGHPYPRTGIFQWGGAPAEWYAKFDLVDCYSYSSEFAQSIKAINPETWIVNTSDWNIDL